MLLINITNINNIISMNKLENYMFTNANLNRYNSSLVKLNQLYKNIKSNNKQNYINKNIINNTQNKIVNNSNNKSQYFTPNTNDKLFWIFYIILYGFDKYNLNNKYEFKTEKQFKIDLVDKMRENKAHIKSLKYKLNDLENELINENKISLKILHLMCFLFNKSVLYINNKIYYDFNYGDKYNIIYFIDNNPKLLTDNNFDNNFINNIVNNYILINPAKPIKGVSSYKINELQEIANKLEIEIVNNIHKKKTKQVLYDEIFLKIKKLM